MVPHHLHEPYTEQCLRAGKHVLLEKPVSHTLASCQRVVRAVEAHPDLVCMVAENSQFWPEVRDPGSLAVNCIFPPFALRLWLILKTYCCWLPWCQVVKAKELIEEGVIGEPYFAQANYWESMGG